MSNIRMLITVILIYAMASHNIKSQNSTYAGGIAIYKVKSNNISVNGKSESQEHNFISDLLDRAASQDSDITIIVKFNNHSSLSEYDNLIDDKDFVKGLDFAHLRAKGDGATYYDWHNNSVLQTRVSKDKKYVVKSKFDNSKWKLIDESKSIKGYECKKAVHTLHRNSITNELLQIVAWYTPSIALPIGPSKHFGLPGTIIEIDEKSVSYYLHSIQFTDEEVLYFDPTMLEGEHITLEEFAKKQKTFETDFYKKIKKAMDTVNGKN